MSFIAEVIRYLRHDRFVFQHEIMQNERRAERAYQGSMVSAMEVTREAKRVRTNADFIREVMNGHG